MGESNNEKRILAAKLVEVASRQMEVAALHRQKRLLDIRKNEDSYFMRKRPALKGRIYIPLPIVAGFVDTLKAGLDDPPRLVFGHQGLANLKKAQKVTAAWEIQSGPTRDAWAYKDRSATVLAIFSGRAIFKYFANRVERGGKVKYGSNLGVVDAFNFLCEPKGGSNLDNHLFLGEQNIFKLKDQLEDGISAGVYDAENTSKIISASVLQEKKIDQLSQEQQERYTLLGLSPESNSYVGQEVANLTEWYMTWAGKRYYLLFDPISRLWVRCNELKENFESELYPFSSWATHEDPFNFWSKAPIDDIRPPAEGMEIVFNEGLHNLRKRNSPQVAFDPSVFPEPSQLEWQRPDQLVQADSKLGARAIQNGIYTMTTSDNTQITVNLFEFVDRFLGQKSGITPSAQGATDKDVKVGVYYGDLARVSDRLGNTNKSRIECVQKLGVRFVEGLKENMDEAMLVKMVGTRGVDWDELKRTELKGVDDFDITVMGSATEMAENEQSRVKRHEALRAIVSHPKLAAKVSDKWLVEQMLAAGGYEAAEIRQGMDLGYDGSMEVLSEADAAVEAILKGKEPKPYRGATTAFIQYILDYATDNEVTDDEYQGLIAYARAHFGYAKENAVRRARLSASLTALVEPTPQAGPAGAESAVDVRVPMAAGKVVGEQPAMPRQMGGVRQ